MSESFIDSEHYYGRTYLFVDPFPNSRYTFSKRPIDPRYSPLHATMAKMLSFFERQGIQEDSSIDEREEIYYEPGDDEVVKRFRRVSRQYALAYQQHIVSTIKSEKIESSNPPE